MEVLSSLLLDLPTTPIGWLRTSGWFFTFWSIASVPAFALHKVIGEPFLKKAYMHTNGFSAAVRQGADSPLAALRRDQQNRAAKTRHVFIPRIDQLSQDAGRIRNVVKRQRRRIEKAVRKGGGLTGALGQLKNLNKGVSKLNELQKVHPEDAHELAIEGRGGLLRVLIYTPIAVALLVLNTFMLNKVFADLGFGYRLHAFGLVFQISLVLSFLYTLAELALGFVLEQFNERARFVDEKSRGMWSARAFVLFLIFCVIAFETAIYSLISYTNMSGVLPQQLVDQAPWLQGWFGIFGFVLAGSIAMFGYLVGQSWNELVRHGPNATLGEQAERYNIMVEEVQKKLGAIDQQIQTQGNDLRALFDGQNDAKDNFNPDELLAQLDVSLKRLQELSGLDDTQIIHLSKKETPDSVDEPSRAMGISAIFIPVICAAFVALTYFFSGTGSIFAGRASALLLASVGVVLLAVLSGYFVSWRNDIGLVQANGEVRFQTTHWSRGWYFRLVGALGLAAILVIGGFFITGFEGSQRYLVMGGYAGFMLVGVAAGTVFSELWLGAIYIVRSLFAGIIYSGALIVSAVSYAIGMVMLAVYGAIAIVAAPMLTMWTGVTRAFDSRKQARVMAELAA